MSAPEETEADIAALNDLIVNSAEFTELESKLGGFNLFQVLKFEYGEIRHSNVLAWILHPAETHGLADLFLQKWLMRVVHEADANENLSVSAVDIDAWQLAGVEVRREWKNIDLFLVLRLVDGQFWTIAIENKVNSKQHSDQLSRYRKLVEEEFPNARHQLFLFLTKENEIPADPAYLSASYSQVHQALGECLSNRSHAIGEEPKVLLENYQRLLEEKFMEDSEIARLAFKIYQRHKRALDVLFEHRPDNLRVASDQVERRLRAHAEKLQIRMEPCSRSYIRFVPQAWIHPGNSRGTGWAASDCTVLFELSFHHSKVSLYVISGNAPDEWIDPMWERSAKPPFKRKKREVRPRYWCSLHVPRPKGFSLDDDSLVDPDEIGEKIFSWFEGVYSEPTTQEVIHIIADSLPDLERAFAKSAN